MANNNNKNKVVTTYQNIDNNRFFDSKFSVLSEESNKQLETDSYKFNDEYFTRLQDDGNYEEAYNYAKCFHFRDRQMECNYKANLENFRDNMASAQDYQNQLNQHKNGKQIDFYNNVFSGGKIDVNNKYNIEFDKLKRKVGSKINYKTGEIAQEATDLEITFAPNKMKELWYEVDNENNFDVFCKNMNVSKEDLINSGIEVKTLKDGSTSIRFSKQNPLSNKILYCIPQNGDKGTNFIEGYSDAKEKRNPRNQNRIFERPDINVAIKGLMPDGKGGYTEIFNSTHNKLLIAENDPYLTETQDNIYAFAEIQDIRNFINKTKTEAKDFNNKFEAKKIQSSVTIGSITSDAIEELNQQYINGEIDYTTFAKKKNIEISNLKGLAQSGGYTKMYTNFYDANGDIRGIDDTDETMREADSKNFVNVVNYLTQQDTKDLIFQAGYMGDEAGLFITVKAMGESGADEKDETKHTRVKIFLPGFATDLVNAMRSQDLNLNAKHKCDNIISTGHNYNLERGQSISFSQEKNSFIFNDPRNGIRQTMTRGEAERRIAATQSIEDITINLIQDYMKTSGQITDNLEDDILANAIYTVKECLPGQESNFVKDDGTSYRSNELFVMRNGKLIINPDIDLKDKNYEAAMMITYIFNNVQGNLKNHYSPNIRDSRSVKFKTL